MGFVGLRCISCLGSRIVNFTPHDVMNDNKAGAIQAEISREALAGRLPILSEERIYSRFGSFLWTCTSFSAATWAFLIGGSLPSVGNTVIGILGYLCGVILGLVPVVLA